MGDDTSLREVARRKSSLPDAWRLANGSNARNADFRKLDATNFFIRRGSKRSRNEEVTEVAPVRLSRRCSIVASGDGRSGFSTYGANKMINPYASVGVEACLQKVRQKA